MNFKDTDEWQPVNQIFLTYEGARHDVVLDAVVEAKGEARRVMARPSRGSERVVMARWRDGIPASVRVVPPTKIAADQKAQYERQLMAYVAGTDPLRRPEDIDVDIRPPESVAEDLRWA